MSIKDSGNRTEFASGAVRDIQEGKGRCDLLPLDVVAELVPGAYARVFSALSRFQMTGDVFHLFKVLETFGEAAFGGECSMLLEVAKHFEEGAAKYGENNWQKGLPVRSYLNSGVRHLLKWLRNDKDEPHDRAFAWNILCAIWTCRHKPELNDYGKGESHDTGRESA